MSAALGRSPGSRARARITATSRTLGTPGWTEDGSGGSPVSRATATAPAESPPHARRPVSISNSTSPAE